MTDAPPFDPDAVSRDPADYRATQHFTQQVRYRQLPKPTAGLAAEAIREGDLTAATYDHQAAFEHRVGPHTWRVVVDLTGDAPHPLITIFAKDAHGRGKHGIPGVGE